MKLIVLGLSFAALLAFGAAALAQPANPGYDQQQRDYQDQQQQYKDAQGQYQHQLGVYEQRRANYEAARAKYDADHGQGAFVRYYSDRPDEYDRTYGPGAYDRDFGPR